MQLSGHIDGSHIMKTKVQWPENHEKRSQIMEEKGQLTPSR